MKSKYLIHLPKNFAESQSVSCYECRVFKSLPECVKRDNLHSYTKITFLNDCKIESQSIITEREYKQFLWVKLCSLHKEKIDFIYLLHSREAPLIQQ